jgi:hypothetical protein
MRRCTELAPRLSGDDLREKQIVRAAEAIADLADFDLHRHPLLDLLTRAWKLRDNVTA